MTYNFHDKPFLNLTKQLMLPSEILQSKTCIETFRGVTRGLEKKIERVPLLVFEATGPLFSPRTHDTVWYEGWDWLQLQNSLIKYNHVRSLSNTDYHLFFLTVLITVTGLATMVYLLLGGTQGMMVRITWTLKGEEIASGGLWRSLIIFLEIRTF